jgi:hypothetical protein
MRKERPSGKTMLESEPKQRKSKPEQSTKWTKRIQQNEQPKSQKQEQWQFPRRNWAERKQLSTLRKKCKYPSYKLFHVEVSIDNVTTHALIDSGPSVSAMSEYFFSRLSKNVVKNKLDTQDEKLHSICGQSLEITGIYELPISLDANVHSLNQQFYFIPKLTETCILGMDFITRNSVVLNGKTRKLSYMIDNDTFTINDEIKKLRHYKVTLSSVNLANNITPIKIDSADLEMNREKITNLLNKYKDMTAENLYELGKAEGIKHKIPTTGQIVYQRPRRQARALQKFVRKEVKEMLACGIISPSTSPHNTPIHLAKKKCGEYRFSWISAIKFDNDKR